MYHMRRPEKSINEEEMLSVIKAHNHLTFAICMDNEPYLVTVNYGFDENTRCFYFHCGNKGKKIDFLKNNNKVWGQILDDRGYLTGECNYNYCTVQFKGTAHFVENNEDKFKSLGLMIDQMEEDPEKVKNKMLNINKLNGVTIVRIDIKTMTGKKYAET